MYQHTDDDRHCGIAPDGTRIANENASDTDNDSDKTAAADSESPRASDETKSEKHETEEPSDADETLSKPMSDLNLHQKGSEDQPRVFIENVSS